MTATQKTINISLIIFITLLLVICWLWQDNAFSATVADTGSLSKIRNTFKSEAEGWYTHFKTFANNLFYFCAMLEVAWMGIQIVLNRSDIGEQIKQFVLFIMAAGFFFAVINNYVPWLTDIRIWFEKVASSAMNMDFNSLIDLPMMVAFDIMRLIGIATATLGISEIGTILGFYIAGFIVLICLALITAQTILIHCEFYVATMAAFILVGFGATSFLREYAKNALKYAFSACFKLFVLNLLLAMGLKFIHQYTGMSAIQFPAVLTLMGIALVLLALVKSLPELVSGILSGSHVGSGLGLMTAAATVGAAAGAIGGAALTAGAAIGGGIKGAVQTGQNLRDAASMANMEGKTGLGKLSSMVGHMRGARNDAKLDSEKSLGTRTRSAMQERLQGMRLDQAKASSPAAPAGGVAPSASPGPQAPAAAPAPSAPDSSPGTSSAASSISGAPLEAHPPLSELNKDLR